MKYTVSKATRSEEYLMVVMTLSSFLKLCVGPILLHLSRFESWFFFPVVEGTTVVKYVSYHNSLFARPAAASHLLYLGSHWYLR